MPCRRAQPSSTASGTTPGSVAKPLTKCDAPGSTTVCRGRPATAGLWRTVFSLSAYFERVLHQPAVPWGIVAELINQAEKEQTRTPTTLRKGWGKRKHEFESLDAEALLYAELRHLASLIALDEARFDERLRFFVTHSLWKLDALDTDEGLRRLEARKQRLEKLESNLADVDALTDSANPIVTRTDENTACG